MAFRLNAPFRTINVFTSLVLLLVLSISGCREETRGTTNKSETSSKTSVKTEPTTEVKQVKENQPIPYGVSSQEDPNLPEGQTKVVQAGQNGTKEVTYSVTYVDGKETKREVVSETVLVQLFLKRF